MRDSHQVAGCLAPQKLSCGNVCIPTRVGYIIFYMNTYPTRKEVIVIPCGGSKVDHAAKARDLYTGSAFRETLAAAISEVGANNVFILSAKYGLVTLEAELEPYDVKMGDKGAIDKDAWKLLDLAEQIFEFGLHEDDVDVMAMLPVAYFNVLDQTIRNMGGMPVLVTYEGTAGIGDQKSIAKKIRERNAA
jgi:hypothetical protein